VSASVVALERDLQMKHPTTKLVPPKLQVEVDTQLVPLVKHCWRLGLTTRYCCQGTPDPANVGPIGLGYIGFDSVLAATVFSGLVVGHLGDEVLLTTKYESPCLICTKLVQVGVQAVWRPKKGVMHVDCCLPVLQPEGDIVRFRNCDIARMTQRLAAWRIPLADLIGAACVQPDPLPAAPRRCALASCHLPLPVAMRKDARYCCRRHQLADRHRGVGGDKGCP